MKKIKSLSVFFPVFNEQDNLGHLIKEANEILPKVAQRYEILLINDGSIDNTKEVAIGLAKKYPNIRIINHVKNKGYGEALKTGIKESQYEWIFFSDSDLQFDLGQIVELIKYTNKYDVIIGFRKKRSEGFLRHFNASLFKLYIDILFRLHVKDIDCAFKLFKAQIVKDLKLNSGSAFTSSEILYRLKKKGLVFKQVPVDHFPRRFGSPTGANIKVIIKACWQALETYLHIKFANK